jgi:hypothetical protein
MSMAGIIKGIVIMYAIAFALNALDARAQETPHATLADCPPGYVLGIEETSEPQLMAKSQVTAPSYVPPSQRQSPDTPNNEASEAPRQFVTGCVKPQAEPAR